MLVVGGKREAAECVVQECSLARCGAHATAAEAGFADARQCARRYYGPIWLGGIEGQPTSWLFLRPGTMSVPLSRLDNQPAPLRFSTMVHEYQVRDGQPSSLVISQLATGQLHHGQPD